MEAAVLSEVFSSDEARRRLPEMLRRFRSGGSTPHFVIGRHRRPEAVLVSISDYRELVAARGATGAGRDLVRERSEEIKRVAARHGGKRLSLFGSAARGEDGSASDIDLLVEMEAGRGLLDLAGLRSELEALLERRVDLVTREGLRSRIRAQVLADAEPL